MPLELSDKGYNTEIEAEGSGNAIEVDGLRYELANIHFHHPAEHLNGRAEMEMHLGHKRTDGGKSRLAVLAVGVVAAESLPANSASVRKSPTAFFDHLAAEAPQGATIDPAELWPATQYLFHRYSGSLTTPPCTENVIWIVFQQPIGLPRADLAKFKARYPMNARPLQPINRHVVLRCCFIRPGDVDFILGE